MRRWGSGVLLAVMVVAGLAAGIFVPGGGASSKASHVTSHSMATTRVTVTATDSKFTLSKRSVPAGTVIFTVTNKGKVSHDFKIAGKKTPLLAPGRSATLRVTFSKKGRYPYLSTVSGQASHGMKGVFSVVAAVTPTYAPPTGPVGTASTTVAVDLNARGSGLIVLSQTTIPSGMVTFVITNNCAGGCTFDLLGIKAGAILEHGQSETWTVALAPGIYRYHCDYDPTFMKGSFTVTP
jgi:plastocyanin